jgi:hypothetical protein
MELNMLSPKLKKKRSPKLNQILLLLILHKEGLTWRQMVGKEQGFIIEPMNKRTVGDLYNKTASQILEEDRLTTQRVEILRTEMNFPRHTLYRTLKTLVEEGSVEKTQEPRKRGRRGELSTRYKIGRGYCRLPVSRPAWPYNSKWFLGKKIERACKTQVCMWPKEKKKFDQIIKRDEVRRAVHIKEAESLRDVSLFFGEPKPLPKEEHDFEAAVLKAKAAVLKAEYDRRQIQIRAYLSFSNRLY